MTTVGQFSSKSPTIKRILKEAAELANSPSREYYAAPLESDLFEWHFTIRGPPAPSHFEGGIYHGRIVLPAAYPLKPPSFKFVTPTGRFEVNREICLSISGHHEETWQPAWGIRTALVAIRSFMDTEAQGQVGGMDASEESRRKLAKQSPSFVCSACGKSNEQIMKEQTELVPESGDGEAKVDEVPDELRLAYREDLSSQTPKPEVKAAEVGSTKSSAGPAAVPGAQTPVTQPAVPIAAPPALAFANAPAGIEELPAWIDKTIYGVIFALIALVWVRYGI